MFTKLLLAGAMAIPLGLFSLAGTAMAESFWSPNGDYSPKYDIPLRQGAPAHPRMSAELSCAAARRMVRDDGYHNVKTDNCGPRSYVFDATRHGRNVVLHVDPRSGHIWQG